MTLGPRLHERIVLVLRPQILSSNTTTTSLWRQPYGATPHDLRNRQCRHCESQRLAHTGPVTLLKSTHYFFVASLPFADPGQRSGLKVCGSCHNFVAVDFEVGTAGLDVLLEESVSDDEPSCKTVRKR
jgi:hypothetical protein